MKQEDKELLLRDLCARLPYQPLCKKVDTEDNFCECDAPLGYSLRDLVGNKIIIKPYIRPMSSMTEEEKEEYRNIDNRSYSCPIDYAHIPASDRIDWLNKNMFDYRGLIPMGLALEAPEGMYK